MTDGRTESHQCYYMHIGNAMYENNKNVNLTELLFFAEPDSGLLYQPLTWALTTGSYGTGILMLKKSIQIISITALGIGIEDLHIHVTETPHGCTTQLNTTEFQRVIRNLLIFENGNSDGNSTRATRLKTNEQICNMRVRKGPDNVADFYYECCRVVSNGRVICDELHTGSLMKIFLTIILIFNVLVIMYIPNILPIDYFIGGYRKLTFQYLPDKPVNVVIKKRWLTSKEEKKMRRGNEQDRDKSVPLSKLWQMPKFLDFLNSSQLVENTAYKLKISKMQFKVNKDSLISEKCNPLNIFRYLYEAFVLCGLRHTESFKECCGSSVFGPLKFPSKSPTWNFCLRRLMRLVLITAMALPWIIRLILYYIYEDNERQDRITFAYENGMIEAFNGGVLSYLTPVHTVFVVCYIIVVIDAALIGILSSQIRKELTLIITRCFKDMYHSSRTRALGWCCQIIVIPFVKLGIFGIFITPFYWVIVIPICVVVMAFYILPTLNITIRLILHFFVHCTPNRRESVPCCDWIGSVFHKAYVLLRLDNLLNFESLERPKSVSTMSRFLHLVAIMLSLLSVASVSLLAMECITFFAEYIVYTIIGVILNADFAMKYVTFAFMILVYVRNTFGGVIGKYKRFNTQIHSIALKRTKEMVQNVALKSHDEQENTAFLLPTELTEGPKHTPELTISSEGFPKWNFSQLIVFLDNDDRLHLTRRFFFEAASMPFSGCPGKPSSSILRAVGNLFTIILFLGFVILTVSVFGDEYNMSGWNQTIATLVTGFIPWVLSNILFKKENAAVLNREYQV